jgi:23S rRNA (cytidine1920-2'-O)/16S rRNA (cytidine1409-2'-O)-methyltransferase
LSAERKRADLLLVERGLFDSRAKAQAAIMAGRVTADGLPVRKASDLLQTNAEISSEAAHPYVSRGGVKLTAALEAFRIDPSGRICADIGASTGGFTDVLLRSGAAKVYAIDVGQGQLHATLASDPRVVGLEKTDVRRIDPALVPDQIALAAVDVSFISLKLVLPAVIVLLGGRADVVALIKPQFEAGREHVGKGVVRDAAVHGAVCAEIEALLRGKGFDILGLIPSPIFGGEGNREFLIGARRG